MKLSNNTLTLLKNYSTINGNLVVKEGNKILTISDKKNIMSSAEVEESFSQPFGIYDLNEFLASISLFSNPLFHFVIYSFTYSRSKFRIFSGLGYDVFWGFQYNLSVL